MTLDFVLDPSVTNVPNSYRDPAAVFSNGQTSLAFTVDTNSNFANIPGSGQFAQGTVAGTLTVRIATMNVSGITGVAQFTTVHSGYDPGGRPDNHANGSVTIPRISPRPDSRLS